MIINLVDRQTGLSQAGAGADWVTENRDLLSALASQVGPSDWSVDLVLVDDGRMTELNEGFRLAGGVTDVLSFSYLVEAGLNGGGAVDVTLPQGSGHAACDLKLDKMDTSDPTTGAGLPVVGEIILAPEFVSRRCAANGWPVELELPMLVVHGLLHIMGWDHLDDDERQAMQDIEVLVLAGENLIHPLRRRS